MMSKKIKVFKILAAALVGILAGSCDKEELPCECTKITKLAYDVYNISQVPCIDGLDGWGGYDEDGNWFNVECK